MVKRIFFIPFCFISFAFGSAESIDKMTGQIESLIDNALLKNTLLQKIKTIDKVNLTQDYEILFLIRQRNELLLNEIKIESTAEERK